MEGQEGERTAPQGPLTLGGLEGPVETSAYPWEDRCLEVEKRGHALGLEEGLLQEGWLFLEGRQGTLKCVCRECGLISALGRGRVMGKA